jgi:adhesin transport system membrane fusion protein
VQGDGPATAAEGELFRARAEKLRQEGSVVASQLFQRRQEFEELKASQRKLQSGLSLAERENEIMQRLRRQGAVPEIEAVRLERQLTTLKGELEVVNLQIPRAQAAIREAENKVEILDSTFRTGAREELAKAGGDLAVLDETMKAASDRVTRTTLRAPVRGIVNKVNVTTLGAVVQPGHTIVEIVPIEDKLLIEARVRPQDVAFIGPGQKATVKITAYDYAIYGSLPGVVERISADTTANDKGETFYRVIVRTDKSQLGSAEKPLPIIPGMIASVDILTGEKSVLSYLMKPLTKARHEALRER